MYTLRSKTNIGEALKASNENQSATQAKTDMSDDTSIFGIGKKFVGSSQWIADVCKFLKNSNKHRKE